MGFANWPRPVLPHANRDDVGGRPEGEEEGAEEEEDGGWRMEDARAPENGNASRKKNVGRGEKGQAAGAEGGITELINVRRSSSR